MEEWSKRSEGRGRELRRKQLPPFEATPVTVSMSSIDSTPALPVVASPTSFGSPLPHVRFSLSQYL